MMDEKIHKQISDAITDGSGQPDDDLETLMADDDEAAATFDEIKILEQHLRDWGYEEPPRQYWKSFPTRITSRLDGDGEDVDEALLEPPAPDTDEELESLDAAEAHDDAEEDESGLGGLAALAGRSSTLPPAKNFDDDDGDVDDEAVLDLGALIAKTDDDEEKVRAEDKGKPSKKRPKSATAKRADSDREKPALASPSKASAPAKQPSNAVYYLVGLLFVALLVVGYIAFGTGDDETAASDDGTDPTTVAVSVPPAEPNPAASQEPEQPEEGEVDTQDQVAEEEDLTPGEDVEEGADGSVEEGDEDESSARRPRRSAARLSKAMDQSRTAEPERASSAPSSPTKASTPAPSKAAATSDLDALLAGATSGGSKRGSASANEAVQAAVGSGDTGTKLPTQPSRSQVRRAMGSVAGQVMACRSLIEAQTRVNATVNVASSGAVQSASVSGGNAAVQQCVKRAVQRARFPRFSQPSFSVTYPFVLSPPE